MNNQQFPKIAGLKSIKQELIPGIYDICLCGRSSSQPFCDGSHKETSFKPFKLVVEEEKRFSFCTCKHSATLPFCDGYHKQIVEELEDLNIRQVP
jgi:CDGSH-type Zn-finger protein